MPTPSPADYAAFYANYVSLVPEGDVLAALALEQARTTDFLTRIPAAEERIHHPPYTWTIRQVIGHVLDTERVFALRALWFARGGTAELPGFDEELFAANSPHGHIPLPDLVAEYNHIRSATRHLFTQLDEVAWERRGIASGAAITVRALAYCVVGHERHHLNILRKRWGGA